MTATTEPISTSKETCFLCGETVFFRMEPGTTLRREAHCERCGAGKRTSDLAQAVLRACLGGEARSLATEAAKLAPLSIYNTQAFGAMHGALRTLPNYVASEYIDGVPIGEVKDGVRCEDLTRLRLESDAFDLVISEEVLEHVSDYEAALLEVRRVLKPGGRFVFTVPVNEAHATQRRALVDDAGRLVERMPSVFHGDPARPEGSLVFTDFGRDLAEILGRLGMPAEDLLLGDWHAPEDVSWISDERTHADYLKHYRGRTLFSAFRYNSHVFVARNLKLPFTGERFVPESSAPVLAEYEHVHRYAFALDFADGRTVLDIACGEGFGSALLAGRAARVVGVDVSAETVRYARERYRHAGNLEFREGSCEKIPCEDASVDLAVSMETIEHISDPDALLREVKRVLRPGGVFLVSTPNPELRRAATEPANPHHVHEMPREEFERRLGGFFRQVVLLGQRAVPASFMNATETDATACRAWVGDAHALKSGAAPRFVPKFFVAVCSDAPVKLPATASALVMPRHDDVLETYVSPAERERLTKQFEEAGRYVRILEAERANLAREAEEARKELRLEVERHAAQFGEAEAYARSLEAERNNLLAQAAQMRKDLEALEAARAKVATRVVELEAERRELIARLEQARAYTKALEEELGGPSGPPGVGTP